MLGDYLREHVEVSCASPRRQRTCAANLRAFFDTYSATDVDIAACRRYVAHRQAAGVADATIRREMSALSAALRHAVKWKRSEEHTSELQSLMRISYAVFCLKKNNQNL